MRTPDIPQGSAATPGWVDAVRMTLQILTGRRGNRLGALREVKLEAELSTPTKAEYDAMGQQVVLLQKQMNALTARLDGGD